MRNVGEIISVNNPVFACYVVYSSILILKMMIMSSLTGVRRMITRSYMNAEDLYMFGGSRVSLNDEVERIRRAHLNDMENILPFISIGLFYVLTDPSALMAMNLFRIVTVTRIVHTIVYALCIVPQPTRTICFAISYGITIYMTFLVILCYIDKKSI